jgi:hypothetical protein
MSVVNPPRLPASPLMMGFALIAVALADLAWLAWPFVWTALGVAMTASSSEAGSSGGVGAVSFGFAETILEFSLMPVPLLLHGAAQLLARQAGADVRRWWMRHVVAVLLSSVGPVSVRALSERQFMAVSEILAPFLILTALVFFAQHLVVALVVVKGLLALREPDIDGPRIDRAPQRGAPTCVPGSCLGRHTTRR